MARLLLRLCPITLVLGLVAGCGNSDDVEVLGDDRPDTEEPERADEEEPAPTASDSAELTMESGFTTGLSSGDTRYTSAGALVTNPNEDLAAYDVQVLFNLVGPDGNILDTSSTDVDYIAPATTVAVAPLQIGFDLPTEPTDLEVAVTGDLREDEGWDGVRFAVHSGIVLEVTEGQLAPEEYGGTRLTAQVMNPSDEIAEFASWACAYKAGGEVIGGDRSTITDRIPPGATVALRNTTPLEVAADEVICTAIA